jgi:hypothetical protein
MDLLSKYNIVIQCTKKAVRLTKKDGTIVKFVAAVQVDQASMLSQMKVTALEEFLVVQEYKDVFPEELPGDEDIPSIDNNIIKNKDATNIVGPVTRKQAKQLEKEIHSQVSANLILINDNILDHSMLSSCCLNILRNDGICARAWDEDGFNPPTVW